MTEMFVSQCSSHLSSKVIYLSFQLEQQYKQNSVAAKKHTYKSDNMLLLMINKWL